MSMREDLITIEKEYGQEILNNWRRLLLMHSKELAPEALHAYVEALKPYIDFVDMEP